MIADLEPYAKYKDSGQPWLGDIPEHWASERAKWLFTKMDRPVRADDEVVTCFRDGVVTLRRNRRLRGFTEATVYSGYQGICKGDLVIHMMDAFAGAVGVSDSDGKGTPVYSVCLPRTGVSANYYAQLVRQMSQSQWILALAKGIRERSTDFRFEMFGNQRVPFPPPDEQAAIVRFLDWANGRLERAIRAKRKVIALLNEQKQAIIHRAVTRGLDPSVPLKPSGIPWLGEIPRHWEVRRAKQLCTAIVDCKNRTPDMVDGGEYIVVRTTNIRHGIFNPMGSYSTNRRNFDIWTQRGAPRVGDVFFTREAPVGEACHVPDQGNLCMGQRMMYFRPNAAVLDSDFLLNSIYGPVVRRYIEIEANGSTVGHLRLGQVSALPLLWCSIKEQKAIVAHIGIESAPLGVAISRLDREIGLLREYRTRLVADIVTGKLDVREAAARLAHEAPLDAAEEDAELGGETEAVDEEAIVE
jgi:type I restriction enzyme, S subunit